MIRYFLKIIKKNDEIPTAKFRFIKKTYYWMIYCFENNKPLRISYKLHYDRLMRLIDYGILKKVNWDDPYDFYVRIDHTIFAV